MEAGGQGLLKATVWRGGWSVKVPGLSPAQRTKRRELRVVGEGHDCLTCTSFSWGGSVEKEELGVQQTLLIQNAQSPWDLPAPPSTPTCRVVPASSGSGRDPYALDPTSVEVPFSGDLLASSPQSPPGPRYPHWAHIVSLPIPQLLLTRNSPGTGRPLLQADQAS